ncbi:MAG: efflux RND transporter periplasmic adaptor subunit [bacterium]|nr:efflux RND transporter periplasmic adaptor subunit [bacterium]
MKHIPVWIKVIVVIAVLIASKFIFFSKKEAKSGAGAKDKNSVPVGVNFYVVRAGTLNNSVYASGKIGALNQVNIMPEVSGKIMSIYFKEGETIKKGSLLLKLNDADLQAQLLKVRTQMKLSEQKLERLKKLLTINGISQEEYDMQDHELMAQKADEAFYLAEIAKTNITAPFDGVLGLKNVSEGSFVSPIASIVSLVQLKPLFVEFSIPEKYSSIFKRGGTVLFSADDGQGASTFSANIYAIEPQVDEATKTIKARALYHGDAVFYPGSYVKVFVNLGTIQNALMVPTQAVVATLKGQKVFVNRNHVAVEIPIQIGVRTDQQIQVLEGLSVGDTIITSGLLSVRKESKLKLIAPRN